MVKKFYILLLLSITALGFSTETLFQPKDLFDIKWIENFTLDPNGDWIVFTVKSYYLDKNEHNTDIFQISSQGGEIKQLTSCPGFDGHPVWSPDGSLLAFISDRTGSKQIFILPMDGGEARQLSQIHGNIEKFQWSPDGRYFTCLVQNPKLDTNINYENFSGSWNLQNNYSLLIIPIDGTGSLLLKNITYTEFVKNLPTGMNFSISKNGDNILFSNFTENENLTSVNLDIYKATLKGNKIYAITQSKAIDISPIYSPDNKYIAYQNTSKLNHLFDQTDISILHNKNNYLENLTSGFDLDICEMTWGPNSDCLYFLAKDQGRNAIFSVKTKNKKIKGLLHSGYNTNLAVSPDERFLYFIRSKADKPPEIFRCTEKGDDLFQLTFLNSEIANSYSFNPIEDVWYTTSTNKLVHGLMLKPANFDPTHKYPLLVFLHDGPHSSWNDEFSLHWNYQIFLSQGYVIAALNTRGSKGYGQSFSDQSQKNWGSLCYKDVLTGLDYFKIHYSFIDEENIAVAGEGFGGYLIYWALTNIEIPFKCGISHDGIFNPISFYGSTSIPMLPYWEFAGTPQNENRYYIRWNPAIKMRSSQTPVLITHSENDNIVPFGQSIEAFTALNVENRPIKYYLYLNETRHLSQTQNIIHWYNTSLDWLKQWSK